MQFNKLEKIEIGGTKGKDLSESVRWIGSISMVYCAPVVDARVPRGLFLGFGVKFLRHEVCARSFMTG